MSTTAEEAAESTAVDLGGRLGHAFGQPDLLAEALTHTSALPQRRSGRARQRARQAPERSYERLEFLGDRVLGLVIADLLWRRFPDEAEGHLTRRLTHLVRREMLAHIATSIELGRHLRLSPSEAASGAAHNAGILADVMEAVIAAVYLDGGFAAAFAVIDHLWQPMIAAMDAPPRDPKTTLQEWAQGRRLPLPEYRLVATTGPDHAPEFTVAVQVSGQEEAIASGSSKRSAEIAAAAALLEQLASTGRGTKHASG